MSSKPSIGNDLIKSKSRCLPFREGGTADRAAAGPHGAERDYEGRQNPNLPRMVRIFEPLVERKMTGGGNKN